MPPVLTPEERIALDALCIALLPSLSPEEGDDPSLFALDAITRGVPDRVEQSLAGLSESDSSRFRLFLRMLEQPLFVAFQIGRPAKFSSLSQSEAERVLSSLSTSFVPDLRAGFQGIRKLATFHYYSAATESSEKIWKAIGYKPTPNAAPVPSSLVLTDVEAETTLECDACVIGSGAAGSVAAALLAEAGLDVVVLESGSAWQSEQFDQREDPGTRELFLDSGTTSTRDLSMSLFAGAALGGGTTVNWQTSLRTPDDVLAEWAETSGCAHFASDSFSQSLDAVWSRLSIGTSESIPNPNNAALRDGCIALGYDWAVTPRNSRGCDLEQCGYCMYGCRHGGKQTAAVTYLTDAQRTGRTRVIARCLAERILIDDREARGVSATVTTPRGERVALTVKARKIVAACGSIHTPALLLRSDVRNPQIGRNLHVHPTTAVGALFDHPIEAWRGAPQSVVCNEFADVRDGYGFRIEAAPGHPGLIALATPWTGSRAQRREMQSTSHRALLVALIRDRSTGVVRLDQGGRPIVDYRPGDAEAALLKQGMAETARILHAAGAKGISTVHTSPLAFGDSANAGRRFRDIEALCAAIAASKVRDNHCGLFSAHQMGTCRMGLDPRSAVCDERGEVHGVRGLFIADASAFPGSCGVNPMVTIMALAHHTARGIAAR